MRTDGQSFPLLLIFSLTVVNVRSLYSSKTELGGTSGIEITKFLSVLVGIELLTSDFLGNSPACEPLDYHLLLLKQATSKHVGKTFLMCSLILPTIINIVLWDILCVLRNLEKCKYYSSLTTGQMLNMGAKLLRTIVRSGENEYQMQIMENISYSLSFSADLRRHLFKFVQ